MQKIIFLDFDGVLLCDPSARAQADAGLTHNNYLSTVEFDPEPVANLNRILGVSGAEIVLSTSWASHSISDISRCLLRNGIDPSLIYTYDDPSARTYMTPRRLNSARDSEIGRWLDRHPHVTNWVAIDDLPSVKNLGPRGLQTDPVVGLDSQTAAEALRWLQKSG